MNYMYLFVNLTCLCYCADVDYDGQQQQQEQQEQDVPIIQEGPPGLTNTTFKPSHHAFTLNVGIGFNL